MSLFFYRLGVFLYSLLIKIAAQLGLSSKANLWVKGRANIFQNLQHTFQDKPTPIIWIHAASLGEFEQGRPLIEKLKEKHPEYKILLTFFSPSGYEIQKNYTYVDWVFYLPIDSPKNAAQLISIIQPKIVFFIKYEFWYYYLQELKTKQIPTYLVSATFRPKHIFFKWYGGLFRKMLFSFDHIFVQDSDSQILLKQINYNTTTISGDTRLDRVLMIKEQRKKYPISDLFCNNQPTIVCGSTWPKDENLIYHFLQKNKDYNFVIAPHEIDSVHINKIKALFHEFYPVCYSDNPSAEALANTTILIIDNIGMLSSLYAYANMAYIGGGLGAGIHNSLEAAVFEIPIFFGPNYHKFKEAKDLIQLEVAFEVQNAKDMLQIVQRIKNIESLNKITHQAQKYIKLNSGATEQILKHISL